MITSIAGWKCKCGISVQVITETDRANSDHPDTLKAACPNCDDKQVIYGHRIVSVSGSPYKRETPAFYRSTQLAFAALIQSRSASRCKKAG